MPPFTESYDSAFDSGVRRERHNTADPAVTRLHAEAVKIVKQCGHNFDLMVTKLIAKTKRDSDLAYAVHEIFIKAVFSEIEPDKVPVRGHVRSSSGKNEGDARSGQKVRANANIVLPVSASPSNRHMPGKRNPAEKLATITAQQNTAARILTTRKTFDGRLWGDITLHELRGRASDSKIAVKLIEMYESTWQALPTDSTLGKVLTPDQFEAACKSAGIE